MNQYLFASATTRAKVARVSECPLPPAMLALEVEAGDAADVEELSQDAERRYTKLRRMIMHGISTSGGYTPRAAIIAALKEQPKRRKNGTTNRVRQPGKSEEGLGHLLFFGRGPLPTFYQDWDLPTMGPCG